MRDTETLYYAADDEGVRDPAKISFVVLEYEDVTYHKIHVTIDGIKYEFKPFDKQKNTWISVKAWNQDEYTIIFNTFKEFVRKFPDEHMILQNRNINVETNRILLRFADNYQSIRNKYHDEKTLTWPPDPANPAFQADSDCAIQ